MNKRAENVVSKHSVPKWYVRSGSSFIEAKGEILDELRDTARIPFDERGNANIELNDISKVLVYDYLLKREFDQINGLKPNQL